MPLRNVFLSHHHADEAEVKRFYADADGRACHCRMVDSSLEPINSDNYDYVMRVIRQQHLSDSSVTIVMIGRCTKTRKYVDWEIASTLRDDPVNHRSGLMGIYLPSVSQLQESLRVQMIPPRLADNVRSGYAKVYSYPQTISQLQGWIDDAFAARIGRALLFDNSLDAFTYNRVCV